MNLVRKVVFNTLAQSIGKILSIFSSLILVGSLARYLGVSGFGEYSTIFAYVAFLGVLADFGFFNALVRELSAGKEKAGKVVNNILTIRIIFALLIYLVGFGVATLLNYSSEIKLGIGIISFAQFWLTLSVTIVGIFQANFRMDKAAIAEVAGRVITLIIVLLLIGAKADLLVILSAYAVGNFINFVIALLLAWPYVPIKLQLDWQYCRRIVPETVSLGVLSVISYVYFHIDMIILSLLKSSYEVGIYGAAYKILDILVMFPAIFVGAIFPVITRYHAQRDNRLNQVAQQTFNFLLLIGAPAAAVLFVLAKPIIGLVAGGNFIDSALPQISLFGIPATPVLILRILSLVLFLFFFSNFFNSVLVAASKQKSLVVPNLLVMGLNIILNIIFIPRYSYLAAAVITVSSEIVILIMALWVTYKSNIDLPELQIVPKVFAGLFLMITSTAVMTGFLSSIIASVLGVIIYLTALYLLGGLPKEVFAQLLSQKGNNESNT